MTSLKRIAQNRQARERHAAKVAELDAQLQELVEAAFGDNIPWQDIADVLGVSKARVYQIRDGRR